MMRSSLAFATYGKFFITILAILSPPGDLLFLSFLYIVLSSSMVQERRLSVSVGSSVRVSTWASIVCFIRTSWGGGSWWNWCKVFRRRVALSGSVNPGALGEMSSGIGEDFLVKRLTTCHKLLSEALSPVRNSLQLAFRCSEIAFLTSWAARWKFSLFSCVLFCCHMRRRRFLVFIAAVIAGSC